jgi:hypothetical protein
VNRRVLTIIVALVTLSAVAHADYRESFANGVREYGRRRWPQVIAEMRAALAEKADDPGESIAVSGFGNRSPYLPSFYLGIALYSTGDCVNALNALRAFAKTGANAPDRGQYTRATTECEKKVGGVKPPPPPSSITPTGPDPAALNAAIKNAEGAINRAEGIEARLSQLSTDSLLSKVWSNESSLGAAAQRARDTLNRARSEFDAGRRESNLQRLQEAATLAASAAQGFEAVRVTAENRRLELTPKPPPPTTIPIPPPTTIRPLPPQPPSVGSTPVTVPPKATPFTPPAPLAQAARLFFSARYQEASAALGNLRYDSGPAAGHAALLRAATQYSIYLVNGEKDPNLVEQARQAIREQRRVAPALQPDPRAFSPRFIAFYNETK